MNFCSRECIAAGEPRAGTGVRAQAYVFLPVAKRLWGEREFNARWASPEELEAIRAARAGGVVTRLYNPQPGIEAALVYRGPTAAAGLEPLLETVSRRWPVLADEAPRFAVCTQGKRERCCAKWGYAVFSRASALHAQGRFPFQPLECSHLGGDRFAATGLVFPSGSMYAHLDTVDLGDLGAAEAAGRIAPAIYRGRVYDTPLAQVARAGLARDGLLNHGTTPLQVEALAPHQVEATATDLGLSFRVSLDQAEIDFVASCDHLEVHRRSKARRTVYVAGAPAAP
ncbi:sucrase ferredoxin [Phenylobacterium sp.]|jgi:hypothetical protein|uniref:sucrase ferredoxin n=1 Tax=Phenylobacterium sp. TaxID=1871053 RepID=UPI002F95805D